MFFCPVPLADGAFSVVGCAYLALVVATTTDLQLNSMYLFIQFISPQLERVKTISTK